MSARVGLALVGCGQIAARHVAAIQATPGIELRAVCDLDRTRREAWASRCAVPGLATLEEVLARRDVDLVAICTPNHLHAPMARQALAAGRHALVEKPVALRAVEVLELDDAFRRRGLALFPVLQVRFNPAVLAVREVLGPGGLGRLHGASLIQRWNRAPAYFAGADNWRGRLALEGGALYTQGLHYLDLLVQLAGPVATVSARAATQAHAIETEDAVVAHLEFTSGALGVFEFSLNAYQRNVEASLSFLGERGTVILGGPAANEISHWNVASRAAPRDLVVAAPNTYDGSYVGSPPNHASIYRNVAEHLLGGAPIAVTPASAVASLALIEAIYLSSRSERPVALPGARA